jgi:manganese/zinc/iron transport system permease protein
MALFQQLIRVLTLTDYNTRVVMFGTVLLGLAGGVVGVFLLLRRRSLLADAVGHAALPGVALAFIIILQMGGNPRSLPLLMVGALVSGLLGMATVLFITKWTRLSQDVALGIVLSVFFGFGVVLLGIIQRMRGAPAAGLNSFIYGRTASMILNDAILIGTMAGIVVVLTFLLFKEFRLFTFDSAFAAGDGWPVTLLDSLLMALAVSVTIIGLQAVGIILIIAILVIPPAAATFWTNKLRTLVVISALVGAIGAYFGTSLSAIIPRMPAGAAIVVSQGSFFLISLLFGIEKGLVHELIAQRSHNRKVLRQHLLRALFEYQELSEQHPLCCSNQIDFLLSARPWTKTQFLPGLGRLVRQEKVVQLSKNQWKLTPTGLEEAKRITRNHRLWEIYLMEYAATAVAHVDQGADYIEHILGDELVAELEKLLPQFGTPVPESYHPLSQQGGTP